MHNNVEGSSGLNAPGSVFNAPVHLYSDWSPKDRIPTPGELLPTGSVQPPYGYLPPQLHGRDRLVQELVRPGRNRRIHVLSGMGGVGKTATALTVASMMEEKGHRVLWINGSSPDGAAAGFRHAALLAGASPEVALHAWRESMQRAADLLWHHLADWDKPWFLVIDNADDLDVLTCPGSRLSSGAGWIRQPVGRCQGIVVTTRDTNKRVWGNRLATFHGVQGVDETSGARILLDLAPTAGVIADARRLSIRLSSLPLALHLAGSYLAEAGEDPLATARTFADYVDAVSRSPLFLDIHEPESAGDLRSSEERARHTIGRTWELSLDLLRLRGLISASWVLQVLSCYAPGILLPRHVADPDAITAHRPGYAEADQIRDALYGLKRFGLLAVAEHAAEPRFLVHRLVAEVTLASLKHRSPDQRDVWNTARDLLLQCTPSHGRDPALWREWDEVVSHWRSIIDHEQSWSAPGASKDLLVTAESAISYLRSRGDYVAANEFGRSVVDQAVAHGEPEEKLRGVHYQSILILRDSGDLLGADEGFRALTEKNATSFGERDPRTLACRYEAAVVMARRGEHTEAVAEFDEVISAETAAFGEDNHYTLLSRHDRALSLTALGRYDEAEREIRTILDLFTRLVGESNPDTLASRHELAVILRNKQQLAEAETEFRRVLEAETKVLGERHPSTLKTRLNLALTMQIAGDDESAEDGIRVLLGDAEEVLGPRHPDTLVIRHALATCLVRAGSTNVKRAEEEFRRILDFQGAQLVPHHPTVLVGRGNLAATLRLQGNHGEAVAIFRNILNIREKHLGPRHPLTLATRYEWATALGHNGDHRRAERELKGTLRKLQDTLGPDHPSCLATMAAIGSNLLLQGKLRAAESQLRQALSACDRNRENTKTEARNIRNDLAATLHAAGKWKEASALFQEILRGGEGADIESEVVESINGLALTLKDLGQIDEAAELYRRLLDSSAVSRLDSRPMVLTLRHNRAVVWRLLGRVDEAEAEHISILGELQKTFGEEHQNILSSRHSLARAWLEQGKSAKAEAEYRSVLEIRRNNFGAEHPSTIYTWGNLAFLLLATERFPEAEAEYRRTLEVCRRRLGKTHPETLTTENNLAITLLRLGEFAEARVLLEHVVKARSRLLGSDHPDTLEARDSLAWARSGTSA